MLTEMQSKESVHNQQTFEVENENTIVSVPPFSLERKEVLLEELKRIDTDPGSLEEGEEEEIEESIRLLPKIVRELVSMDDDPTLPTITFRYVNMGAHFF